VAWTTYVWVDDVGATAARAVEAGGTIVHGPTDSLEGGQVAILADPGGAVFGLWAPGRHRGAQRVNEPGAYSMSMLHAADVEAAAAFYGAVFGWTTEAFGPATMFRLPGFVGGEPQQPVSREVVAVMIPAGEGEPARWAVDFWIDDADAAAARAPDLGGAVVAGPYETPTHRQAVLADPAGATFSVSTLKR
jgi:predicted enzyme related to lactoylglutathione lyase